MTDPKLRAFEDALQTVEEMAREGGLLSAQGMCFGVDEADAFTAARSSVIRIYGEAVKDGERHTELLMAVGNKHEGESRHETALRYIRQTENSPSQVGAARNSGASHE